MAFKPIAACVEVLCTYTWLPTGRNFRTVFHAQPQTLDAPYQDSINVGQCNSTMTAYGSSLFPHISAELQLQAVTLTDLAVEGGVQATSNIAAIPGEDSAPPLPTGVALCVSMYTSSRGRSYRGRAYIPGWTTATTDDNGDFGPTAIGQAVSGVDALNTSLGAPLAAGLQLAIASKKLGIATQVINVFGRKNIPRYQRRREVDHSGRLR